MKLSVVGLLILVSGLVVACTTSAASVPPIQPLTQQQVDTPATPTQPQQVFPVAYPAAQGEGLVLAVLQGKIYIGDKTSVMDNRMYAGKDVRFSFQIRNDGSIPFDYVVGKELPSNLVDADTGITYGSADEDMLKWVRIITTKGTLDVGETGEIEVKLSIPGGVKYPERWTFNIVPSPVVNSKVVATSATRVFVWMR